MRLKKLESSLKNMVVVLTAITVIATGLLAYVNQRKMFRQAVHSLSHIIPACTHGITVTAVRQPIGKASRADNLYTVIKNE